jgi:hypothetical protein
MADRLVLFLNDYGFPESIDVTNDSLTVGGLKVTSGLTITNTGIAMNDDDITGVNSITFTDVDGTIAGIANKNLVDKSAAESITGTWTFSQIDFALATSTIGGIENQNLVDKSATESITGTWTFSQIDFALATSTIGGIENQNLLDKTATESVSGLWSFNTYLPQSTLTPNDPKDFITKSYADNLISGVDAKDSVRAATTGPITLTGTQTIDNIALSVDQRVLVKNQPGTKEVSSVDTVADVSGNLGGKYFDISSITTDYRVWYNVSGGSSAPSAGGKTLVEVGIVANDTNVTVATNTKTALDAIVGTPFATVRGTNDLTITNNVAGNSANVSAGNSGFTVGTDTQGKAIGWDNGIYLVKSAGWVRTVDTDTWLELVSSFVFVEEGSVNADTGWVCTVDNGGTLNTDSVPFVQFSAAGVLTPGFGLGNTGNVWWVDTSALVSGDYGLESNGVDGAETLRVKLATAAGLRFNTGLEVYLDGSTLTKTGTGLKVSTNGITDNELYSAGNFTETGKWDFGGGKLVIPTSVDATTPEEGSVYWSGKSMYGYDFASTSWIKIGRDAGRIDALGGEAGGISDADVVYVSASGTVKKARADAWATVESVVGFADEAIPSGLSGGVITNGMKEKTGWGLTPGDIYYLDDGVAGGITNLYSNLDTGDWIVTVGRAFTATKMIVDIDVIGRK